MIVGDQVQLYFYRATDTSISLTILLNLLYIFLISDFRRDLNIENVLLGISPASNCNWPTFRNPVSVPSSKAGGRLWGVRGSKV